MLQLAFLLLFILLAYALRRPPFQLFVFAFPAALLINFFSGVAPFAMLEHLSVSLLAAFFLFLLGVFTDLDFFVVVLLGMLLQVQIFGYPAVIPIAGLLFLLRIVASIGAEFGMLARRFGTLRLIGLLLEPLVKAPALFLLNTLFFLFIFVDIYFFAGLLGKPGLGPLLVLFIFIFLKDILTGRYHRHIMGLIFLLGGYLAFMDPALVLNKGTLVFFAFTFFMLTYMRAYGLVDAKLSRTVKVAGLKEGMILKGQYKERDGNVVYHSDAITAMHEALQKGMAKGLVEFAKTMTDYLATESIGGTLTKAEIRQLKAWARAGKLNPTVQVRNAEPRSVSFLSALALVLLLAYFRILA